MFKSLCGCTVFRQPSIPAATECSMSNCWDISCYQMEFLQPASHTMIFQVSNSLIVEWAILALHNIKKVFIYTFIVVPILYWCIWVIFCGRNALMLLFQKVEVCWMCVSVEKTTGLRVLFINVHDVLTSCLKLAHINTTLPLPLNE